MLSTWWMLKSSQVENSPLGIPQSSKINISLVDLMYTYSDSSEWSLSHLFVQNSTCASRGNRTGKVWTTYRILWVPQKEKSIRSKWWLQECTTSPSMTSWTRTCSVLFEQFKKNILLKVTIKLWNTLTYGRNFRMRRWLDSRMRSSSWNRWFGDWVSSNADRKE